MAGGLRGILVTISYGNDDLSLTVGYKIWNGAVALSILLLIIIHDISRNFKIR